MSDFSALGVLLGAVVVDFLIGDPRNLPHFVNYVAWLATRLEKRLWRSGRLGFLMGCLFYLLVLVFSIFPCALLLFSIEKLFAPFSWVFGVFLIFQSIAYRDLIRHIERIIKPLETGNLVEAREKLSWVVGRDTESLDDSEISRAAIETLAESMNDGVVAPLFWAILLGPLGAIAFRVTNTLDSMVGHRDERYEWFGKVSARMDDLMGYIPARIIGFSLYFIGGGTLRHLRRFIEDAKKHSSWNAGYPEAAVAHALNIRLGGVNVYDSIEHHGPVFNCEANQASSEHIIAALLLVRNTYLTLLLISFSVFASVLLFVCVVNCC